jgi:hypothetical protein
LKGEYEEQNAEGIAQKVPQKAKKTKREG